MSVLLANKLASQTIPGTQLMRLIAEAYEDDPVRLHGCWQDSRSSYISCETAARTLPAALASEPDTPAFLHI